MIRVPASPPASRTRAHLAAEGHEIAAVEPHACRPQPGRDDRPRGRDRVVGVDEQRSSVRRRARGTHGTPRSRARTTSPTSAPSCPRPGCRSGSPPRRSTSRRSRRRRPPAPHGARRRGRARGGCRTRSRGRPCAACTMRAALLAMLVWNVMVASSAVSTSCASSAGAVTRRIGSCANTTSPSATAQTSPVKRKAGSRSAKNASGAAASAGTVRR